MTIRPTGIKVEREKQTMTVTWEDGHVSVYPFKLLRAGCPCASCRGGHENMGPEPDPDVFTQYTLLPDGPQVEIKDVYQTGMYGITIAWGDYHDDGIYNWHYLRALCPCESCQANRKG
jgi:DUF971 family protein